MKVSRFKQALVDKEKHQANVLYQQGFSLRQVGQFIGKSHEWVRSAVKELDNVEKSEKSA